MTTQAGVMSYVLSGCSAAGVPGGRTCPLPPAGPAGRGARLPDLAVAMAKQLMAGRKATPALSVITGTALGCLTETAAFVEGMIRDQEASPLPRAFAASVHNAVSSRIAIALGARGESQTFVHGSSSFAHALFAAGRRLLAAGSGEVIAGAVDEWTEYVARGQAACGGAEDGGRSEGGALLLLAPTDHDGPLIARIRIVRFGAPRDGRAWFRSALDGADVGLVLAGGGERMRIARELLEATGVSAMSYAPLVGTHPSGGAAAVALTAGVLAGEIDPGVLRLTTAPRSMAVATGSRSGERAVVVLEAAT